MGLFTIEFELGPHTRESIERVATTLADAVRAAAHDASLEIEAGPRTLRSMSETGASSSSGAAQEAIKGVIRRGAEKARGESA